MADVEYKLIIPPILPLQTDGYSCVPRCVKTVLEYFRTYLDVKMPSLDISDIAGMLETREDGTLPEKVRNLNSNRYVMKARPSLEFEVELKKHSLQEIEDELKAKRPLIAWIEVSQGSHRFAHAVVIAGIDIENNLISYTDPIFGEVREDLGAFVSKWDSLDRVLIKIRIGQRRLLDEFLDENEVSATTDGERAKE